MRVKVNTMAGRLRLAAAPPALFFLFCDRLMGKVRKNSVLQRLCPSAPLTYVLFLWRVKIDCFTITEQFSCIKELKLNKIWLAAVPSALFFLLCDRLMGKVIKNSVLQKLHLSASLTYAIFLWCAKSDCFTISEQFACIKELKLNQLWLCSF